MLSPGSFGAAEVTPDQDSSCGCRATERSQHFSGWEAGQDETEGKKWLGQVLRATLKGLAQFRELWDDSKAFKQKKKIPFKTFLSVYSGEWIVL